MKITQIDAFADRPFAGNPAAVCLLDSWPADDWMQRVAQEMNLAETAFLVPGGDGYALRWFTPEVEVDLCGHATLASAHLLWEEGHLAPDQTARFHTRSGLLTAVRQDDWIMLDFPATPARPVEPPPGLMEALEATPLFVGKNQWDFLIDVGSERIVRSLAPDHTRLKRIDARGIIVTGRAETPGLDFVSRFFAPACGIPEDPVTGSAHSCLGPYWAERLGKTDMIAYQASPRGGMVRVQMRGDRVGLGGQAATVLRGELLV